MTKKKIIVWIIVFIVGIFYQPNWVYLNFYYNPRWVDDAWWSLSYLAYLMIYALISTLLVEILIRSVKKYL